MNCKICCFVYQHEAFIRARTSLVQFVCSHCGHTFGLLYGNEHHSVFCVSLRWCGRAPAESDVLSEGALTWVCLGASGGRRRYWSATTLWSKRILIRSLPRCTKPTFNLATGLLIFLPKSFIFIQKRLKISNIVAVVVDALSSPIVFFLFR